MGAAQALKQVAWPRCRWCQEPIEPIVEDPVPWPRETSWSHVTTKSITCAGRQNKAEPVPAIHEEPFMLAAWEMVARYRTLRRAFREISQSRASAVRRMKDYQELVDEVMDARADFIHTGRIIGSEQDIRLWNAITKLVDYRRSIASAGWR